MAKYYVSEDGILFDREKVLNEMIKYKKISTLSMWKECLKKCFITNSLDEAKKARTDTCDLRMERAGLC